MARNAQNTPWQEKFKGYLSVIIFLGFFIIILMMFFFPIMGGNRELMYSCVGGMATANTVIISYWFTKQHYGRRETPVSFQNAESERKSDSAFP